ncbi:uncharacterized protein LOC111880764 [Lactuca sativa]|nr:uncharacterized protein LOC111880764 [Lactuca sativa]
MSLFKFFRKIDKKAIQEDNEQHKHMRLDLSSLPVDPAERPAIEYYHVNQRDEIRRTYLQKGPFQTQNYKFPQRDFGGELESGIGLNQEVVLGDLGKDNSYRDRKAEAIRIFRLLKSFDFVFCLHLMVDILGVTNHLNTTLQRKYQDIVNVMNQVSSSKKAIQEIRDVGWEPLLGNVTLFCNKHDVRIVDMEDEYYDGFSRRRGSQVNNLHHYHVDVFKAVIDMQLQELNHRFNEANTKLLLCIACLCPCESFKAFDLDKLMEMATLYKEEFRTEYDLQVLEVELKNYIKDVREDERFNQLKSIG